MRGKTKESHYLITKLFATDYFYFYCKPLLFFTYFFPYQISKNGQFSTYEEFEYEKKMNDIREEKFGKYGNYASQGFGNIAFYKPCVTFQYFYNKYFKFCFIFCQYYVLKYPVFLCVFMCKDYLKY